MIEISHQTGGATAAVVVVDLARGPTAELARLLRRAIGSGDVVTGAGSRAITRPRAKGSGESA